MIKIFKQLGRHWAACIAVVALLFEIGRAHV